MLRYLLNIDRICFELVARNDYNGNSSQSKPYAFSFMRNMKGKIEINYQNEY